jgi:1-acyl-sn-glycerol-3-phosphate acyltransferase
MNWLSTHQRAIGRGLALCVVTSFFYSAWLLLAPFLLFSEKGFHKWRNLSFRRWAKTAAALLGIRIMVIGATPKAPFFLVSNHLSYLDIVVFATQIDCLFVAKSEVAGWPILGLLCKSMGTIFVDRKLRKDVLRVNSIVERVLGNRKGVVLFPEGTSTAGDRVLPFHSALLEPAVKASYPVSFAAVSYRTPSNHPPAAISVCWWGDMPFLSHLYQLLQLKTVDALVTFGSYSIRSDNRKVLAQRLRHAIQEEFHYLRDIGIKCQTTIL